MEEVYQRVNSKLVPTALGGISPAEAKLLENKVDAADAKAGQAQATASAALPKSGGEIAGPLVINNADITKQPLILKYHDFDSANIAEARMLQLAFTDTNSVLIGDLAQRITANGQYWWWLRLFNGDKQTNIGLALEPDGTAYATVPNPRVHNYGTDSVNMKTMRDNTLYYLADGANVYIDPLTGSDTADLFAGRGLSADKAFKSFDAAMLWLQRCAGNNIFVSLVNDAAWNGTIGAANIGMITVMSQSAIRAIIL